MPIGIPKNESGWKSCVIRNALKSILADIQFARRLSVDILQKRFQIAPKLRLPAIANVGVKVALTAIAAFVPAPTLAQSVIQKSPSSTLDLLGKLAEYSVGSSEVILLALFGGAMSFAMMAAFWLIRERNRAADENRQLRDSISDYKAINERNEALVQVDDQRVVIWNNPDDKPIVLGALSNASGAPSSRNEFLSFGKWITPDACKTFEEALVGLRKKADAFDMALQTNNGGVIEAQGRTSGAFAFVRFIELSGERAALAHMETEHTRLLSTFDSIQNLFDRLDMQVWLSKKDGSLYWANEAYAKAVEAVDSLAVIDNDSRLFDCTQREEIQSALSKTGFYNGAIPAIISGDRKIVDVVEVISQSGGAGIAVDKSDVENIRSALEETNTSHANTLDQLTTAIAIFDAKQRLEFYNSSFEELWSFEPGFLDSKPSNSDILGAMRDKKLLPPQPDWRKWRDGQLEIYQALEAHEDWWHLPDARTLRVVVNPQSLGGATWIFEDVTEELELKSNYNSLVRVQGETLDHLNEAVAVFGPDGKLRLSNPALWKMFGIEDKAIAAGDHITKLTEVLSPKIESHDVWEDIVSTVTGYDDERSSGMGRIYLEGNNIVEFAVAPLPDGRTMLTLFDVTANVNIERALTERNDALEQAGNLKNRFLQHVSYELRTPLTTISGFGELLSMEQTGKLNSVQEEYLGHINTSSATLKAIIDDILDLATIDAGAMELELKEFNITPIIEGVVKSLIPALEKNHVSITLNIDPSAEELIADNTRFRQIIYNLITNAIDHSPNGGVVTVESILDGNNIFISVSDQGPGVPTDERENIFSRFESGTSGHSKKGAGLGLSIVKSFMVLHEGNVVVKDAGKRGAKFVCSFPVNPDDIKQAAQ